MAAVFSPVSMVVTGAWYYLLSVFATAYVVILKTVRSLTRKITNKKKVVQKDTKWSLPRPTAKTLTARDGVSLKYFITAPTGKKTREECKVMVFSNGLGVNGEMVAFAPLVHHFGTDEWIYITWNYRGLFHSEQPKRTRRLAIVEHAEDLREIITKEGVTTIDILCGHSMGVQVSLEMAALYPERVERLILLNGTYGQVFHAAFQPLFRVPGLHNAINRMVQFLMDHPWAINGLVKYLQITTPPSIKLYSFFFRSDLLDQLLGENYLIKFLNNYFLDICSSPQHCRNYLRLFQELDAHSLFHLLHTIQHPALVVSGLLDIFTPAYGSFDIAARMPNSMHCVCPLASHASLLETPERVIQALEVFMNRRYQRANSINFHYD
eukprot:GILK01003458.1.p1 GENE.GILK01003458.1~~GILK01003458.1.p1  ORF type:complete len:393 (-),score=44.09 GILK01003458.1:84-1223(-)